MDLFPLLTPKPQFHTSEEPEKKILNELVNNIIDLAFQDTLWTGCPDTCGDLKRSLQKVNENGLLKISLPFKDFCCPYPKDAK